MTMTTAMQTMKQFLVRPYCQRNAVTIRFVCWFIGVVSLLAVGTYYLTRNMDDMVAGIDIDGFNERDARERPMSDDEEDNDRGDKEKNFPDVYSAASNEVKEDWENERQQDRDPDVDFEDNNAASRRRDRRRDGKASDVVGRRRRRDEKADKNGVDASDADYARELREQEVGREGNAGNVGDRDGEAAANYDDVDRRRGEADDDNPVHNDVDDGQGDEAGKNREKDAINDEIGEENAADAAVRNQQRGKGEDVADDDGHQRAADDVNQFQDDVDADQGDKAGKDKEENAKNDKIGEENAADAGHRNGEGEDAAIHDSGHRRRTSVDDAQGDETGRDKEQDSQNDKIGKGNAGDANRNANGEDKGNDDDGHERGPAADDDNQVDNDRGDKAGKDKENDAKNDKVGQDAEDANEDQNEGDNTAEEDAGKSYNTCDAECLTFRGELASWPSDKPKAFIYYLIHRPVMRYLRKSIRALHQNFNSRFRYPIVVFVEPDLDNEVDRQRITDMVPTDGESTPPSIYVQVVRFQIPDYVNASLVSRMAGFGRRKRTIGYRHMCRFHAGGVYDQPIVRSAGLEYAWRLDHDSVIRRPIDYDLFQVMRDGGYLYGYRQINTGWSPVDSALWDEVDRYLNATPSLQPAFYRQWPKNAARYFNNFEVSDLRVWMSPQYRDYFNFVDRLGGIYYHKWGDAAIKTIAVTLFIPRDRTHLFTGISYFH